ncbi:MAG: hypothetical protein NC917_04295 [Candidatus Omnitrophica bacterium]|nr:hypothetical protein [Candidatus Omnitrophota bacterium]MCM8810851.1 hypothetical protein [Candidatus Omnitrophota bacterium]
MNLKKIKLLLIMNIFSILIWYLGEAVENHEIIVDKISSYFTKIFSIQFEGDMEMNLISSNPNISPLLISNHNLKFKFFANGNKYRTEVSFFDPFIKRNIQKIICWNGEKYQLLEIGAKRHLLISKFLPEINPYFIPNPLLFPFTFLFKKEDNFSLNSYQNISMIKERLKNIEKIEEGKRGEYKGVYIYLLKEGLWEDNRFNKIERYEIFLVKDLNYFPIYFQIFIGKDIREEMEVKEILMYKDIIIPISIYSSMYEKGKLLQTVKVVLNKESVKVNIPIEVDFFSIPFSHADEVWDADSRIRIK